MSIKSLSTTSKGMKEMAFWCLAYDDEGPSPTDEGVKSSYSNLQETITQGVIFSVKIGNLQGSWDWGSIATLGPSSTSHLHSP